MKKLGISIIMISILCAFTMNIGFAQSYETSTTDAQTGEVTFEKYNSKQEVVGKTKLRLPEYSGGLDSLYIFMDENLKYPEALKSIKAEGTTLVQFMVETDGSLSEIAIIRSSGYPEMDDEALRVVKLFPNWKPATKDGAVFAMKTQLPVKFTYEEEK